MSHKWDVSFTLRFTLDLESRDLSDSLYLVMNYYYEISLNLTLRIVYFQAKIANSFYINITS